MEWRLWRIEGKGDSREGKRGIKDMLEMEGWVRRFVRSKE